MRICPMYLMYCHKAIHYGGQALYNIHVHDTTLELRYHCEHISKMNCLYTIFSWIISPMQ